MEEKQFRQGIFEKKNKYNKAERTKALSQIDLDQIGQYKKNNLIKDYLDANDKIMQLEEEDRAQLKKDKIEPFQLEVLNQFKQHIKVIKHGQEHEYASYYKQKYINQQQRKQQKQVLDDFHI